MREILFRGKRKGNGKWVEGLYTKRVETLFSESNTERHFILVQERDNTGRLMNMLSWYDVIPETVGQYTGLTDKNGDRIFEGDILEYTNEDGEVQYVSVVFEECAFLIEDHGITDSSLLTSYVCLGLEVAGNIHDNPELLKGE